MIDDRCAKGEPVQTYGFCAVTFEIGGEMISGDAIVADIPGSQVLIGMDLLEDLDCSIDIASKKLIVGKLGMSVPLYKEKVQRCARVEVSETMYVPTGFEMRLPGQVTGRWESWGPTGRVEELVSFHRYSNLMVAKALESPVAQVGKAMNLDWRWKGEVGCEEGGVVNTLGKWVFSVVNRRWKRDGVERGQPMGVTQLTESMTRARRTGTGRGKQLAEGLVKKGSQAANKGSSQEVLASRTAPVRPRGPSVGPARKLAPEKGGMGPSGMAPMVSKPATHHDRGLPKDLLRVHRPGCTRTASMKFGIMPLHRRTWLRCH